MTRILRKSQENHKTQVRENAKKITLHILYMPEIDTGSLLQTLVQRSRLFFNSHGHKNISISSQNIRIIIIIIIIISLFRVGLIGSFKLINANH